MFNPLKSKVMKTQIKKFRFIIPVLLLFVGTQVYGQRGRRVDNRPRTERVVNKKKVVDNRYHNNRRYRTQPIRNDYRYRYPRRRRVVRTLPRVHRRVVFRGTPFCYSSGVFYISSGSEYVVVFPPRGFRINVLPVGHVRIVFGPRVYFYYGGVYYIENPTPESEDKYEVVTPPIGTVVETLPEDVSTVDIDGKTHYQYDDIIYEKISVDGKTSYKVVMYVDNE